MQFRQMCMNSFQIRTHTIFIQIYLSSSPINNNLFLFYPMSTFQFKRIHLQTHLVQRITTYVCMNMGARKRNRTINPTHGIYVYRPIHSHKHAHTHIQRLVVWFRHHHYTDAWCTTLKTSRSICATQRMSFPTLVCTVVNWVVQRETRGIKVCQTASVCIAHNKTFIKWIIEQ